MRGRQWRVRIYHGERSDNSPRIYLTSTWTHTTDAAKARVFASRASAMAAIRAVYGGGSIVVKGFDGTYEWILAEPDEIVED